MSALGRMTANSSPPTRNARSPRRMACMTMRPRPERSSSPCAWPCSSLTFLRSSTSTSSRDRLRVVARGVLELSAQLLLERPVVAEAGECVEERVLARLPVEVDEPGALFLEALRVAQDRVDEPGHDQRQHDGAAGEDEDGHPAAQSVGPETLDRGHAHEHDEDHRQDTDGPAADVPDGAGDVRRFLRFEVMVGHDLPMCGIRRLGCTSRRCLPAPRPKYLALRPMGPRTGARAMTYGRVTSRSRVLTQDSPTSTPPPARGRACARRCRWSRSMLLWLRRVGLALSAYMRARLRPP